MTDDVSMMANKVLSIELNVLLTIDRRGPLTVCICCHISTCNYSEVNFTVYRFF